MAYQRSPEAEKVTQLRKGGQLREAYMLAKQQFSQGNREDTFLSSYTWVLHDCLKRYFDKGTRFYRDVSAFKSTLAQIRIFPIDTDRDDLFINQVKQKICSVGWGLRKAGRTADLRLLSEEVCQWQHQSFLFDQEVARMLLVGLRLDQPGAARVLSWLGLKGCQWRDVLAGNFDFQIMDNLNAAVAFPAILWALYDELKISSGDEQGRGFNLMAFTDILAAMRFFNPGNYETREVMTYATGKVVHVGWEMRKAKNQQGLENLLASVKQWGPGTEMHCMDVLTMFSVGLKDNPRGIIDLVEWYGLESLSGSDFNPRIDGEQTYPSRAQDLTKAYLGALEAKDQTGAYIATNSEMETGAEAVSKILERDECKDWIWESYGLGKLLVVLERFSEARARLADIVASKPKDAWSWAAYGRAWKQESEESYEKCLFKGLHVSKDLQTSLAVHEDAMVFFSDKGEYDRAKTEALLVAKFREENGWKPSPRVEAMKENDWFERACARDDNESVYEELASGADDIVAEDLPWTEFYVEWKNEEKNLVGLVMPGLGKDVSSGVFQRLSMKDKRLVDSLELGECYKGHCGPERRALLGKIEYDPQLEISGYFRASYSGEIDLVKDFGFVRSNLGSIWVSPSVLEGTGVKQCQQVSGVCRRTFRNSKNSLQRGRWEWEVVTFELGAEAPADSLEREFEGELDIARKGFGFACGCFIPAKLIVPSWEWSSVTIKFKARRSWDTKKSKWSWTAYEIIESSCDSDEYEYY
ncbi:M48 family metallopeptidase [Adlercreutzia sp. ZJ242]|uniref:tetratricopeptide repeat protein n=1 Tax=Adlercreutzia sp. ZJ242 TaxID=2709409 RepID=UPI0013EC0D6E|nr:hypothetical protein [Adlercreutzia sp. ZJ242]